MDLVTNSKGNVSYRDRTEVCRSTISYRILPPLLESGRGVIEQDLVKRITKEQR